MASKVTLLTLLLLGVNTCGARDSLKVVNELTKASAKLMMLVILILYELFFWILSDEQRFMQLHAYLANNSLNSLNKRGIQAKLHFQQLVSKFSGALAKSPSWLK